MISIFFRMKAALIISQILLTRWKRNGYLHISEEKEKKNELSYLMCDRLIPRLEYRLRGNLSMIVWVLLSRENSSYQTLDFVF